MVNGKPIQDALTSVCVLVLLAAGIVTVHHCVGCTPADQQSLGKGVENGAAVMQYDLALVECQRAARAFPIDERFDAYIRCERAVSRHYCEESLELRKTWTRCAEVMR